eukprot:765824-Hanusia_phi.AAC.2
MIGPAIRSSHRVPPRPVTLLSKLKLGRTATRCARPRPLWQFKALSTVRATVTAGMMIRGSTCTPRAART